MFSCQGVNLQRKLFKKTKKKKNQKKKNSKTTHLNAVRFGGKQAYHKTFSYFLTKKLGHRRSYNVRWICPAGVEEFGFNASKFSRVQPCGEEKS